MFISKNKRQNQMTENAKIILWLVVILVVVPMIIFIVTGIIMKKKHDRSRAEAEAEFKTQIRTI